MTFTADIAKFVKKANENVTQVVHGVVIELGTRVIIRNPVGDGKYWKRPPPEGYVGGRSRANWQYGFGDMPTGTVNAVDKSGRQTIDALTGGVQGSKAAGVHWIANNVEYINRLEEGWSRQAPNGMVRVTVMEFQTLVNKAARGVK